MESFIIELKEIAKKLEPFSKEMDNPQIKKPLEKLSESANIVGKSWSNSYCGYHSRVYYKDFKEPPPGAHFSIEWGLMQSFSNGTTGDWYEYPFEYVINIIEKLAGNPNLKYFENKSEEAKRLFYIIRDDILSILEIINSNIVDVFIVEQIAKIKKHKIFTMEDFANNNFPSGNILSRDTKALQQGLQSPPHLNIISNLFGLSAPIQLCKMLFEDLNVIIKHLSRISKPVTLSVNIKEQKIFIGHGHSLIWKDLKDFIKDTLNLEFEEFNRIPVAGISTKDRLEEMLNNCSFAFLIMTGEDELEDKTLRARENVVHEIGLFQGRLGFNKAIVLIEDGCDKFSNIDGLGRIDFPKNKINYIFEEIRKVLVREKIIK